MPSDKKNTDKSEKSNIVSLEGMTVPIPDPNTVNALKEKLNNKELDKLVDANNKSIWTYYPTNIPLLLIARTTPSEKTFGKNKVKKITPASLLIWIAKDEDIFQKVKAKTAVPSNFNGMFLGGLGKYIRISKSLFGGLVDIRLYGLLKTLEEANGGSSKSGSASADIDDEETFSF